MAKGNRGNNGSSNGILDSLLAMAGGLADSRRDNAAALLGDFAESIRTVIETVPGLESLRNYADAAAESLEGLAQYVSETELETIASDAGDFMRQHPVMTITGSVAAGLAVAQMVKASTGSSSSFEEEEMPRARRKPKKQQNVESNNEQNFADV